MGKSQRRVRGYWRDIFRIFILMTPNVAVVVPAMLYVPATL